MLTRSVYKYVHRKIDRMFLELELLICVMGISVLLTYVEAYKSPVANELWAGLPRVPWSISTMITTASFVYVSKVWICDIERVFDEPFSELAHFVLVGYVLLLTGAVLWVPFTLLSIRTRQKPFIVFLVLWMTVSGSIVLFAMSLGLDQHALVKVASGWLVFHHLVFDAIWWWNTWRPNKDALLTIHEAPLFRDVPF